MKRRTRMGGFVIDVLEERILNDEPPLIKEEEKFDEGEGKDLIEINIDTIRQLKNSGRYFEAERLLNAYYESKEKNKSQYEKELKSQAYQIKKHISQKKGVCILDGCNRPPLKNYLKCKYHSSKNRKV